MQEPLLMLQIPLRQVVIQVVTCVAVCCDPEEYSIGHDFLMTMFNV